MKVYGCICLNGEKILLVLGRRAGKWSFPKGHMKPSESAHQCALRELSEETGVCIDSETKYMGEKKLPIGQYFIYEMEQEPILSVNDTAEVEDIGWFSLNEIRQLPCNRDVSSFLGMVGT